MVKLTDVKFNNTAKVIGKVSENKLEVVQNAKRMVNGKETTDGLIKGSIVIQTGENETNEVFVEFLYKTTKAGGVNKKFAGLETLATELKTIKEAGYENADTVEVSNALFVTDTYNGRDGVRNSKDKFKINGFAGFINRKENLDESLFGATVDLDVVISDIKQEFKTVDDEREETGRIIVEGHYLNVYNGNATTTGATKFVVAAGEGADYIQSQFNKLSFVELAVDVVNFQEKKEVVKERGFGKPKVETSYNYKRENLIVGADAKLHEEEPIVFEREELEKTIQALEQKLAEKESKTNNSNTQSARSQGFGGQSAAKPKQLLSDDPFNPFG